MLASKASVGVAAVSVAEARNRIVEAARAVAARVLASQLNESDRQNITANLDLEVKREKLGEFEKAVAGAGDIISRAINRSADTENTIDSKVLVKLSIVAADRMAPRQTTMLAVEVRDVEAAVADVQALAATSGGKVAASNLSKDREGRTVGKVSLDIPSEKANDVVEHTRGLGTVRVFDSSRNPQAPEGKLARSRVDITFGNAEAIVAPGTGVGASIRNALATSVAGLLFSLQILIVGLCFVVPWVVVIWGGWKFVRRGRRASAGAVTAT